MSETITPPGPSGNRWEPAADTRTAPADHPSYGEPAVPAQPLAPSRAERLRDAVRRVPRSSLLAAAAAALLIVSFFGGFLVGRVSAPEPVAAQLGQVDQPGQFTGIPGDRGGPRRDGTDDGSTLP